MNSEKVKEIKLKNCPFCGNDDIKVEELEYYKDAFLDVFHYNVDLICRKCRTLKNVESIGKDKKDCENKMFEEWNKRI
jgi:hypothetical protein